MNSKYKVWDRVKIREDLKSNCYYGGVLFVEDMSEYKEGTITNIAKTFSETYVYKIDDNSFMYTDEMIEGLAEEKTSSTYKVGDKVRIKDDLVIDKKYGGTVFVSGMTEYKEVTISKIETRIDGKCVYISEENRYCYTDEMIEGLVLNKYKVGDKVKIREDLIVDEYYGSNSFVENMKSYEEITIKKVFFYDGNIEYKAEENCYYYTEEMIEGLIKEEKGDVDMKKRLNIIEAGNMEVGTKFRLFDEEGKEDESTVEVVESKGSCANKFLAWDGDYNTPLTLADTNVNCYFEVIVDDEEGKEEWKEADFMTAVKHHYENGTIRWGKGDNEVIYDGNESTYFEPLSGYEKDGISSYKIMYGNWYIKVE